MKKYFIPMNDDYRNKHYPNGFLDGATKSTKSLGTFFCIFCVILSVLFAPLVIYGVKLAIQGVSGGENGDVTAGLIFAGIGLVFVLPSIFGFLYGKKCMKKDGGNLLGEWAKRSNYTENVIQDYVNQVLGSDTYIMQLAGKFSAKNNTGVGFLTRDFISLSGVIIKQEDITGVYLVNLKDSIGVGSKVKIIDVLNVGICGKNRSVVSEVKKEAVEELVAILKSRNLKFDTKQGTILTNEEFREIM